MCLIIHIPKEKKITLPDWFTASVFQRNDDGLGVMAATNGKLMVRKVLPKTAEEADQILKHAITFGQEVNSDVLVHFRMRTHGAIDLDNCHPYPIVDLPEYKVWLMHNGVLRNGFKKEDKNKSDTWHYIEQTLKPLLLKQPRIWLTAAFQGLIERDIGSSNKFSLMDNKGNVRIYNRNAGVEWNECWLSNTYAWDAHRAGLLSYQSGYHGYYSSGLYDDEISNTVTNPRRKTNRHGASVTTLPTTTSVTEGAPDRETWVKANERAGEYMKLFREKKWVYAEQLRRDVIRKYILSLADDSKAAQDLKEIRNDIADEWSVLRVIDELAVSFANDVAGHVVDPCESWTLYSLQGKVLWACSGVLSNKLDENPNTGFVATFQRRHFYDVLEMYEQYRNDLNGGDSFSMYARKHKLEEATWHKYGAL